MISKIFTGKYTNEQQPVEETDIVAFSAVVQECYEIIHESAPHVCPCSTMHFAEIQAKVMVLGGLIHIIYTKDIKDALAWVNLEASFNLLQKDMNNFFAEYIEKHGGISHVQETSEGVLISGKKIEA